MFLRVADFHRKFNVLVGEKPGFPTHDVRDLRCDLLREELSEFCEAYTNNDLVEMADAIADMGVIACGTCVSYGIALTEPFGSPYKEGTRQDVFLASRIDTILTRMVKDYEDAEDANDLAAVQARLMWLLQHLFGVALHYGIPFNAVFAEVHRSNMSKLDENGLPIFRNDGKVLKSKQWSPPNIRDILFPKKLPPTHSGTPRFTSIPSGEILNQDK